MIRDDIYSCQHDLVETFCFDEKVVAVFQDMIRRSVPGYGMVLSIISVLAETYLQKKTTVYDLGSSLGASSLALSTVAAARECRIIGIDNSAAMITQCKKNLTKIQPPINIELKREDIRQTELNNTSIVMLNFTLQFIPPTDREPLVKKIFNSLLPNGILILSEKIVGENKESDQFLYNLHHGFKRANGYSQLEVSQKRSSLEGMMITEKITQHKKRLLNSGFRQVELIFQAFNFVTLVAVK